MSSKLLFKLRLFECESRTVHVIGDDIVSLKTKGCRIFNISSGDFVTEDGTVIEDFEVLAEISKTQQVYLKPNTCQEVTPLETPSNTSTTAEAQESSSSLADDSLYFPVFDIVREARTGLKGETAEEIIAALKGTPAANDHHRQLIINACGTFLMNNCHDNGQYRPGSTSYLKMAKSLIHFFPSLANKGSKRPHDIYFDEKTGKGYLEAYVRGKRHRMGISRPRQSQAGSKRIRTVAVETLDEQSIQEAEMFMRIHPLNEQNSIIMLEKFRLTRASRRQYINDKKNGATIILNKYIRLQDMIEAVNDEFQFLYESSIDKFLANWAKVERNVSQYVQTTRNQSQVAQTLIDLKLAGEMFDAFKYTLCSIELCIHMLPNNSAAMRKQGIVGASEALKYLFTERNETLLPDRVAETLSEMKQPGIVKICNQFFIKIEGLMLKLPDNSRLQETLGYLVMYHCILGLKYAEPVKMFLCLCEMLFEIKPSVNSPNIKRVWGALTV